MSRIHPVKQAGGVDHPATPTSPMHTIGQLVHRGQVFIDTALLDEHSGHLVMQVALACGSALPLFQRETVSGRMFKTFATSRDRMAPQVRRPLLPVEPTGRH